MRVTFGPYVLDNATRQLLRAGMPLHLSPKAFQLFALLVEARPAVIDRAALRQKLWPDTHVVDAALGNLIAEIRSALGEDGSLVRTAHGVGYAFDGDARDVQPSRSEANEPPRYWLVWGERALVLDRQENVIGRDPMCSVWIDAPGVSRRHALIRIPSDGLDDTPTIEDLNSTNGTEVNGQMIARSTALADSDVLLLGEATLTFRAWHHADAPTRRVKRSRG